MLYLEDYVELIEHLPIDLRDRFTDMREMDLQVQNTVDDLNGQVKALFRECLAKKGKIDGADQRFETIRTTYRKALDDADEKVQFAGQIYDLVDRHLRKLDQELAKFKMELEADNGGITEILERRSLELDNPIAQSSHSQSRRHAANTNMVTSQSSVNLISTALQNGPVEKRMKLDPVPESYRSESAPPSVLSSDLLGSVSGFESDRSSSRPPSRGSFSGSRQSNNSTGDISLPTFTLGSEPQLPRRGSSSKLYQDALNANETIQKTEGPFHDAASATSSHKSSVNEDLLDEDSMNSNHDLSMMSPTGFGVSRPSRTKKQTSKAAAWNQERMQAEARRGHAREREHPTTFATNPAVELAEGTPTAPDWTPDPHEPRYCLCNQVSYGEMVGCDNPKCAIEWFHYGCVGLTEAPKGKWFCPQCVQSMKRRNKNR